MLKFIDDDEAIVLPDENIDIYYHSINVCRRLLAREKLYVSRKVTLTMAKTFLPIFMPNFGFLEPKKAHVYVAIVVVKTPFRMMVCGLSRQPEISDYEDEVFSVTEQAYA